MPVAMRICSSVEMRELDALAEKEFGISAKILMENAGRAAAQILLEKYPQAGVSDEILVFAGKGNNAGDAFVVARRLVCLERRVRVFHLQDESGYRGAALENFQILKAMKAKMTLLESSGDLAEFLQKASGPFTVVDGILGTGLKGPLEGIFADTVQTISQMESSAVIALDIPSGVNGDTGEVNGESVLATLTISFGFPKLGHFLPPGASRRGELVNVDISLPPQFRHEGTQFLLMKDPMSRLLGDRDRYGHKNSFGHALLVGGSPGRLGAICLSAMACHKVGTGLVTAATWPEGFDTLLQRLPLETMAMPLAWSGPEFESYKQNLGHYSSVVVGPGFGLRAEGKQLLLDILRHYPGPAVLDADALNLVADHGLHADLSSRKAPLVLTPHPGEMARLLGVTKDQVTRDPVAAIRKAVALTHATVLLKGAATLIASPEDAVYLNHYPNDGMATAGSGDVLAGIIGGLLGQKMKPFSATLLGVYLHSLAGDFAAQKQGHRSMTATDIIGNIGNAIQEIKENAQRLQGTPFSLESRTYLR